MTSHAEVSADPRDPEQALDVELRFHVRRASGARPDRRRLRDLCRAVLTGEGVVGHVGLTILLVDDVEIGRLNLRHRGIDAATDVLSFPLTVAGSLEVPPFAVPPNHVIELGDVVVSHPRAVAQAAAYGHSVDRELGYLIAHGVLHILGHDHEEEAERAIMRAREEEALGTVGLTR